MKHRPLLPSLAPLLLLAAPLEAAAPTGNAFYGDAPDATHPWAIHDRNRPQPKRVEPAAQTGQPPSDAIVLFDGTAASLEKWEADTKPGDPTAPTKWIAKDGALECVPRSGYIRTKEKFADCQLHVEWAAPVKVEGSSQGRGNSGVFLMGLVEVQVLDNYNNPTYADGFAGSVYGINPPLANALRPPGEFQSYDIIFRRPLHRDGKLIDPGYLTVYCNGVLVQDHTPLEGPGGHMRRSSAIAFPEAGAFKLQDHGNPVRFRNIWYRPLPPRPAEGGTDGGFLTAEATTVKRREIAAAIRTDAAQLPAGSIAAMLRLAESITYEKDAATARQVDQFAASYVAGITTLSSAELEKRKSEITGVLKAFQYLAKFNLAAKDHPALVALDKINKAQAWDLPPGKQNAKKKQQ